VAFRGRSAIALAAAWTLSPDRTGPDRLRTATVTVRIVANKECVATSAALDS